MMPLPPPPPAIVWQQVAETALQDNNLKADIRVDENHLFIAHQKKNSSTLPSREKTLEVLKTDLSIFFHQALTTLASEIGITHESSGEGEDFFKEAESSLTTIANQLEENVNNPDISTSQAIQEAERDTFRALYCLRKSFSHPQQEDQSLSSPSGEKSIIQPTQPPETLVLSGGGMKGVGYMGAYKAWEESGILQNISLIAGSSVGAMTAACIAAGINATTLQEISDHTNYMKVLVGESDLPHLQNNRLDRQEGIFAGTYAMKQVSEAINQSLKAFFENNPDLDTQIKSLKVSGTLSDEDASLLYQLKDRFINVTEDSLVTLNRSSITFYELSLLRKLNPSVFKNLTITAFNRTRGREVYLNATTTPSLPIVEAVRISMALPGIFQPVKNADGDLLEDGGIGSNTPSEVSNDPETCLVCAFHDQGIFDKVVTGEKLKPPSFQERLELSCEAILSGNNHLERDKRRDRQKIYEAGPNALDIYHGTISTTDFSASQPTIHAAQLQAETRMWEQLALREHQATQHFVNNSPQGEQ